MIFYCKSIWWWIFPSLKSFDEWLLLKMTQSPLSTSVGVNMKPAETLVCYYKTLQTNSYSQVRAFILACTQCQMGGVWHIAAFSWLKNIVCCGRRRPADTPCSVEPTTYRLQKCYLLANGIAWGTCRCFSSHQEGFFSSAVLSCLGNDIQTFDSLSWVLMFYFQKLLFT